MKIHLESKNFQSCWIFSMSSLREISSESVVGWLLTVDGLFSVVIDFVVVVVVRLGPYLKINTNIVLKEVNAEISTPNLDGSNPFCSGFNGTYTVEPAFTFG